MWLWTFCFYGFAGYLLERGFARATRAEKQARKGFLLLPMCPVYGLGMTAVLALPEGLRTGWVLVLSGAVVTTAVEYGVHWGYDVLLGVQFWDYTGVPGNLRGRVCLPFTLAWGALSAVAVWVFQPMLAALVPEIPPVVTFLMALLVTADGVCSIQILRRTHDTEQLSWRQLRQA